MFDFLFDDEKEGDFCVLLAFAAIGTPISGYTFMRLWEWFILPVFEQAPSLTLSHAVGILLSIRYLTYSARESKHITNYQIILNLLMYPLVVLGMGYLIHTIMY